MKFLPVILLAVVCQAYTPITERSWVKFCKVKDPTYETIPLHGEPDIIHATHILIEEDIAHVPPPFLECDNLAAPHRTNWNQHVYYSSFGFGRNNHRPMTELNSKTSE